MKPVLSKFLLFFIIVICGTALRATPTITIIGKDSIKHQVNTIYNDSGATAIDSNNNDITANIVVTGSVNSNVFGTYKITYTVTDSYGKTSSKSRTVVVTDCIPPTLNTVRGTELMTVCVNDLVFSEPLVTATDNYFPSVNITRIGAYDITKIGDYTITYTATDGAGNESTYKRIIRVVVCQKPRVITTDVQKVYLVNTPVDLLKGISVWDSYYPPSDFINNINGCKIEVTVSNVDNTKPGNYQVIYEATNGSGIKSDATMVMIWIRESLVGVTETSQKSLISIYPNPTTDKITITLNNQQNYTAALSSIDGKTIFTENISATNNTISVGHLAKGIYFLTVTGFNTLYTQKVIIN